MKTCLFPVLGKAGQPENPSEVGPSGDIQM